MNAQHTAGWSRREFLAGLTLAGTAGVIDEYPGRIAAEIPPERSQIRLAQIIGICVAPQYVAEELLLGEGFTEGQYVQVEMNQLYKALATSEFDITIAFVAPFIIQVDAGEPIVLLGGVHVGCYEVFGTDRVRAIRDLKGKAVAVPALGSPHHLFLASMAAYVGLDPRTDITWVAHPPAEAMRLLAEAKIDALVGFPPVPQELRARQRSQYFCCIAAGNQQFVQKHPVATKRALRTILKATNVCAIEPERAARLLVDRGYAKSYDYALQSMKDVPYGKWREYNPEDTVRFFALRLHEIGLIKSTPQKIITQGTDWRFLNELEQELKG